MLALKALLRARNLGFAALFQGIPPYLVLSIDWGRPCQMWFPHSGECLHCMTEKSSASFPTQRKDSGHSPHRTVDNLLGRVQIQGARDSSSNCLRQSLNTSPPISWLNCTSQETEPQKLRRGRWAQGQGGETCKRRQCCETVLLFCEKNLAQVCSS